MSDLRPGHRQSSVQGPSTSSKPKGGTGKRAGVSATDAETERGLSALRPPGWSDEDARHVIDSASTRRARGRTTVSPPPAGPHKTAPAGHRRWFRRSPWPLQKPLTIKVKWRGGPEASYEVHSRGTSGWFPGHMSLHDVIWEIYGRCNHDRA